MHPPRHHFFSGFSLRFWLVFPRLNTRASAVLCRIKSGLKPDFAARCLRNAAAEDFSIFGKIVMANACG